MAKKNRRKRERERKKSATKGKVTKYFEIREKKSNKGEKKRNKMKTNKSSIFMKLNN